MTPKAQRHKNKIDKQDFIKLPQVILLEAHQRGKRGSIFLKTFGTRCQIFLA